MTTTLAQVVTPRIVHKLSKGGSLKAWNTGETNNGRIYCIVIFAITLAMVLSRRLHLKSKHRVGDLQFPY